MVDKGKKHPQRSGIAARFDEVTLAAFTVLLLVTVTAVLVIGVTTVQERIGCGLNDIVSTVMAYPRACR